MFKLDEIWYTKIFAISSCNIRIGYNFRAPTELRMKMVSTHFQEENNNIAFEYEEKYEGLFFYPNSNFPPFSLFSSLSQCTQLIPPPPPHFPCIAVYCMVCNLYVYIWLSKAVTPGVTPINPLLAGSLWPYMCDEYPNYHLSQAKQMLMAFFSLVVVYSCVLFNMNYSLSSLVRWWWQHVITKSHNYAITGAVPCFVPFLFLSRDFSNDKNRMIYCLLILGLYQSLCI